MNQEKLKMWLMVSIIVNALLLGAFVFGFMSEEDTFVGDAPDLSKKEIDILNNADKEEKNAEDKVSKDPAIKDKAPSKPTEEKPAPVPQPNPVVSKSTVPSDIHPGQITKIIENKFALVVRRSMNVPLTYNVPADFDTKFGGVLLWDAETGTWEKYLSVTDVNSDDKNNPMDLWFEGPAETDRILYLRVKDQAGAGSGEGVVKTLMPKNVEMNGWSIVQCYYHADDTGDGPAINKTDKRCQNAIVTLVTN